MHVHGLFRPATGANPRQTKSIWDEVHTRLKREEQALPPPSRANGGPWILGDYLDVVFHVFTADSREYYRLEELWGDVPSSSSPATQLTFPHRGHSSAGRASGWQPEGRGFESRWLHRSGASRRLLVLTGETRFPREPPRQIDALLRERRRSVDSGGWWPRPPCRSRRRARLARLRV